MSHTRSQQVARAAHDAVAKPGRLTKDYLAFARAFPTLIHTCGLVQASAFALAKGGHHAAVLGDVATVLDLPTAQALHDRSRAAELPEYLLLTRRALLAATWVKRYAEALLPEEGRP